MSLPVAALDEGLDLSYVHRGPCSSGRIADDIDEVCECACASNLHPIVLSCWLIEHDMSPPVLANAAPFVAIDRSNPIPTIGSWLPTRHDGLDPSSDWRQFCRGGRKPTLVTDLP